MIMSKTVKQVVDNYIVITDKYSRNNISKNYNSPLYWGEFCVIDQYINGYTKYKEYTDAFAELTDSRISGNIRHCTYRQSCNYSTHSGGKAVRLRQESFRFCQGDSKDCACCP